VRGDAVTATVLRPIPEEAPVPVNNGKPWAMMHDWVCAKMFVQGRTIAEIADFLQRKPTAIVARLSREHRLLIDTDSLMYPGQSFRIHQSYVARLRDLADRWGFMAEFQELQLKFDVPTSKSVFFGLRWNAEGKVTHVKPPVEPGRDRMAWLYDQYILPALNDSDFVSRAETCVQTKFETECAAYFGKLKARFANGDPDWRTTRFEFDYMVSVLRKAFEDRKPATPTIKEPAMSDKIVVETKHFINGVEIKTMTDAQLIDAVKQIEKEIESLSAVKVLSKKIAAKIEECRATLDTVVKFLDAR
jgi:hypothetical protein